MTASAFVASKGFGSKVKLSDDERARMLAIVDRMVQEPPTRTAAEVDVELGEVRASRRRWGQRRMPTRPR